MATNLSPEDVITIIVEELRGALDEAERREGSPSELVSMWGTGAALAVAALLSRLSLRIPALAEALSGPWDPEGNPERSGGAAARREA